ncbi:uncharacterized protein LOC123305345 [Chrysoperla carnea]|uniref:uncharacterized protein LOC123305345 n=1 Tax=Chrysoperla carnea TaxID=189513 RepID=UPI001D07E83B|nr:uncharacterized protein LOC123305345 [Chrysoperla carnea]
MAMTTPALYSSSAGVNSLQRSQNTRQSSNYSLSMTNNGGAPSSSNNHHRKSAVELLAETKAFYVKSETVRGRTQTLPLLSHSRNRHRNERANLQSSLLVSSGIRDTSSSIITSSTLNRRSTGSTTSTAHQSSADMLQNALRKLLDCGSPVTSLENVTNQSSTTASNDMSFDMDCTTPISPPAEYAFCTSASERRYTTRSLSHSQPVSASSTRSGEIPNPHENGCCSAHLVVLAKSLPDLHTARNLSSSFEGSRSNKSATSDVFSLNRDSGGDSSGHLTHKSEPPMPRQRQTTYTSIPPNIVDKQHWSTSTTTMGGNNIDLRRDSGSSTQHSGSYYHNTAYYDAKHNIYDSKNYPQTYSIDIIKNNYETSKNYSKNRYNTTSKSNSFETKPNVHTSYSTQETPRSAGYYDKNSPSSFHEQQSDNIYNRNNYFCRITKHGYPLTMSIARTEIVQTSNDQKIITQKTRITSSSSSNQKSRQQDRGPISPPPPPVLFESHDNTGEIILPPPIECCDNYSQDNTSFMDTIIPPPVFEMENEMYENLEIKHVPEKYKDTRIIHDNVSESSFHENVAPAVQQKNVVYRHSTTTTPPERSSTNNTSIISTTKSNNTECTNDGPMSLPFEDPELSPGLGTFKRQKCFRYKQKANSTNNGRPILRSKSDISDRYRRNSKSQPGLVRKSCGGEISRSVSHLEQFFEQLGLNSDAYDNLFIRSGSDSDSPVYFSDVSTVDSNRPVSQVDSTDAGCTADGVGGVGGGVGVAGGAGNLGPSNNIFRSTEQPSIVERNARIIKWLCNCRKAQLAVPAQGK